MAQIARELKEAELQLPATESFDRTLELRKAKKLEDDALKQKHIDTAWTLAVLDQQEVSLV